jgi:hypothetical protein
VNARLSAVMVAAVLALSGCSSTPTPAVSTPSTSQAPVTTTAVIEHGPAAFLTWMRAASFGEKDFASATDDQLMGLGNTVCGVLSTQPSFGDTVQAITKMNAGTDQSGAQVYPTVSEVQALVKESVLDLCPQNKSLVP